jgi:hypothetical protein
MLDAEAGRWLPTAVELVRAWVKARGIPGGQSGTRTGFLRVLFFPLQFIHSFH